MARRRPWAASRPATSCGSRSISVSLAELLRSAGLVRRPAFWLHAATAAVRLSLAVATAKLRRRAVPVRSLHALVKAALTDAALAATGGAGSGERAMVSLIAEGRDGRANRPGGGQKPAEPTPAAGDDRRAYWEGSIAPRIRGPTASAYEQLKYRRTLGLLPDEADRQGDGARLLGGQVHRNCWHRALATSSPPTFPRPRCSAPGSVASAHGNIDWRRLDLFDDALPDGLDLIVCSEVLYDPRRPRCSRPRRQAPRGSRWRQAAISCRAHAFVLKDEPGRTGHDWDAAFGAKVIAEVLGDHARSRPRALPAERALPRRPVPPPLDGQRARHWRRTSSKPSSAFAGAGLRPACRLGRRRGATRRRRPRERSDRLPILLYHRIAEDGPADLARYRQAPAAFAEQMRWLRRNGYHAVTSDDVARHLAAGRPFAGRPVLISFDDAYRDFHDAAWPILRAHDLIAEVFVVTDKVGGHADWDAAYGPTAPLMGWPQIQALAAAGVRFGSHMASHSHMAELSSREIVLEAARSRAALERALVTALPLDRSAIRRRRRALRAHRTPVRLRERLHHRSRPRRRSARIRCACPASRWWAAGRSRLLSRQCKAFDRRSGRDGPPRLGPHRATTDGEERGEYASRRPSRRRAGRISSGLRFVAGRRRAGFLPGRRLPGAGRGRPASRLCGRHLDRRHQLGDHRRATRPPSASASCASSGRR